MRLEDEFRVAAPPQQVITLFENVERMARCFPGALLTGRNAEGDYLGTMTVSFGPKKVTFAGRAAVKIDREALCGTIFGRANADARNSRLAVRVDFGLREVLDPSTGAVGTIVCIVADAELDGILAPFARTGGVVLGRSLVAEFSQGLASELAAAQRPFNAELEPDRHEHRELAAFSLLSRLIGEVRHRMMQRIRASLAVLGRK